MTSVVDTKPSDMAEGPILHVIVVGFHHKKGCQVEYSYPPLIPGQAPNECPLGWKYLPTLALPDGSHNYEEDTVYFHIPSLKDPQRTIYGVSCFRQIPAEKLKNLTSDITRGTVQKSVCVLSSLPLYGHIQVKMSLITHAYFEEGDFSKVSLLEDAYRHLNSCLSQESQIPLQIFVGLSARDLILQFRHKVVLLFKLILLEKKVIFYQSPVQPLCTTILTLLSLYPGMIERGLEQAACIVPSRPMSPVPDYQDNEKTVEQEELNIISLSKNNNENEKITLGDPQNSLLPRNTSQDTLYDQVTQITHIDPQLCGLPLNIFSEGYLCLPYLSLPYMDLLGDVNVTGYVIGATNVLFKQKKQLIDVLIEVETTHIETTDPDLKRQLHLTTEDLRFADYIVRRVTEPRRDLSMDGVEWEGGDEWIRKQFCIYLLSMLRASLQYDSRQTDYFNSTFINAWRNTNNYKIWSESNNSIINSIELGHSFAGQLSVQDMKLRLSHTIQNTESGRKLNQAMASTGRAVATTGKAVGGALSQAKGAFSNWWNTLTTLQPTVEEGKSDNPCEMNSQVQVNPQ